MIDKKDENKITQCTSNLFLENRKLLSLTGVNEVINFDEEKISLKTSLGPLLIKGSGLKMNKLDVQNGEVVIGGFISSINYLNKKNKVKKNRNLISKIFK
ncbi:sporulation protein YabP [Clostridium perfringens]|nr:sporulation protein YabP [Clostridium perfringens]MDZ4993521.1 sporulation protein YabP [Clostridium perfringens]